MKFNRTEKLLIQFREYVINPFLEKEDVLDAIHLWASKIDKRELLMDKARRLTKGYKSPIAEIAKILEEANEIE